MRIPCVLILYGVMLCNTACGVTTVVNSQRYVEGYPIYKFINLNPFAAISETDLADWKNRWRELEPSERQAYFPDALSTSEKDAEFQAAVSHYEAMIKAGLVNHYELRVITDSGKEVEVYVPQDIYYRLWEKSPHDLAKDGKSYRIEMNIVQVSVGDEKYLRAAATVLVLVDKAPIIRK